MLARPRHEPPRLTPLAALLPLPLAPPQVLCASNDEHDKVEPVVVPAGVPLGERVTVEGYGAAPLDEVNPKKKILERLFPDMKTDASECGCC